MSRTASSNGPGMGRSPKAASPLSGLGIRPSRARIVTARMRRRAAATKPSQPFGLPPHVFLQEHGAELLNACGRVIERGKNRPSVGDREREYLRLAGLCGLKFVGEVWVVDEAGELEDSFVSYGDAGEHHRVRSSHEQVFRSSGGGCVTTARCQRRFTRRLRAFHSP
jgi:hypothetical protein